LKAAQKAGSHPEDGSKLPRAVVVVQSHLATRWTIQAKPVHSGEVVLTASGVAEDAIRCFGSVRTVTAGSVIAVHSAASRHAGNNDGVPIAVISRVPRDEQIIATGSGSTGIVTGQVASPRDGSGFRFDHFAAQYSFMGYEISHQHHCQQGLGSRIYVQAGLAGVAEGVGRTASALSSLCRMWPEWSVRRSVSQNPTVLGCRDDQRRDPRADPSSVL
jgi:hypothetical protein